MRNVGAGSTRRASPADVEALARAAALYRGPFLEDEVVGGGAEEIREQAQRLHVDTLLASAAHRSPAISRETAEAYRRIIASNDLHEAAYRGRMATLARTGDRAGAR